MVENKIDSGSIMESTQLGTGGGEYPADGGVLVRGVCIGSGVPKICVPIVARTREAILDNAEKIVKSKPDLIEFRADWYGELMSRDKLVNLLGCIRERIGELPLLFTIRTVNEGGEAGISVSDYQAICITAIESGFVDLVDVEAFMQEGLLEQICAAAHRKHIVVVASNHDFEKTPEEGELVRRLCYMDEHGADIAKLAVMPNREEDVLSLLSATLKYKRSRAGKPVITMSMSGTGLVSRLVGECFGSAVTFAMVGQASAAGQIPIEEMRSVLDIFHRHL